MTSLELIQILIYLFSLLVFSYPLGKFIAKVLEGERHIFSRPLGWLEGLLNHMGGIYRQEMGWKRYAFAVLIFNFLGFIFLLLLEMFQSYLPLNPQKLPDVPFWLALNTATSFMTNTNWQAYAGETTMGNLVQTLGLTVQNFLSAATGIAIVAALARGLKNYGQELGNFWRDLTRISIYILLPLSLCFSLFLLSQGVVQSFGPNIKVHTLEGYSQIIPQGPVASQIAIKQLGSNGGGFFNANSAHPFENPNPLTNFLEMLALLLLPAAMPIAFGIMVRNQRHGLTIFSTMFVLFIFVLSLSLLDTFISLPYQTLMEGKEVRFGVGNSVLWSMATTSSSNGSVNAALSSLSPLSGGIALLNIMLGEVIFGGVGSGLYGMVLFVIIAVFIAGLMVGRSPEYLGKKIEGKEIRLALIGVLSPSVIILLFSAIAAITSAGTSSLGHIGPHGLSEILYAFSSAAGNNGSAFQSLNSNTNFYNILLSIAMLLGRFVVILSVLAIAGNLVGKKMTQKTLGTFPTEGPLFITLLGSVVLIIGALTFLPALSLGPVMEHFLMILGHSF